MANGVLDRYWAFFASLQGKLDGDLAYEDADAIYLLVDGLALREEAKSLGRFLLEDFVNYVPTRKQADTMTLFLIDEISTLDLNATGLGTFEKARSYGVSVISSAQTYEGLGKHRKRISSASHLILLHRCNDPDEIVRRGGEQHNISASWGVDPGGAATGRGNMALRTQLIVDPNEVRRLQAGEVFVICSGNGQKARVAMQPMRPEQEAKAERFIRAEESQRATKAQAQKQPSQQQAQRPAPEDPQPGHAAGPVSQPPSEII
ncbi:hypothetical protein KDA_48870 [Dictyobacter alpinus]|uniref:TraD/TraG TraM recognition site domain-containing protein n=1 Tax=Dictyobacter alpinus TaxID=2014873 RepID=A0A402BDC2_9CHLR|nr:hypothetical protein [Dictyobacter alpinus]GCE29403.1 hypothetical protein KDA_48870 [Dictyobacter alpinus]